jgi:CRP/FNR family transcriptional regulator, cyclic AMP receptor protein
MSNKSTLEYLSSHEFFSGLGDNNLQFLCENSSELAIKNGQILFRLGENADKFYVVRSGLIAIQIPAILGPDLEIQRLGKDQVLGWSWLISPYKWNFQAMPEADSELLVFDGGMILAKCEQEPRFGYELLKKFAALMSVRLDIARQKIMDEWNPAGFA